MAVVDERVRLVVVVVVLLADEPDEGGRKTGVLFNAVAVLLARVCVGAGAFLVTCDDPSAEVGLTAGLVLVVVVDGGYRVSLFTGSGAADLAGCLTEVVLERPVAPLLKVLALLVDAVALRVRGFTGRRLGEPSEGLGVLVAVVVVEEGFRIDRERCNADIMNTLLVLLSWPRDSVEWDVNVYCDG